MIKAEIVNARTLETTIGRLTHISIIIPSVHHFLSRLRELQVRAERSKQRVISIPQTCISKLILMKRFLQFGHKGISMNQIAYRKPNHVYRSDLCPAGMGGYSHQGFAWRFYLPDDLKFRASNNLLEHMASVISPWIDILAG